jgi:histidyl-tRNA synthetase
LEYLEFLKIPYRVKDELVANRVFCLGTVCEIKEDKNGGEKIPPLASGARYDCLAKKFGAKKELPAFGISASFVSPDKTVSDRRVSGKVAIPKAYLVQLGFEARLKSLEIIEMLRREKISVYHSISRDKIFAQLSAADSLKAPYLLILGQREAADNLVIVRNTATRSQETIKISELAAYLKKLR